MSHDYHVRCLCGETSSEWNIKPEVLVDSVKQSTALRALRRTRWGDNIWSLEFAGRVLDGLAAFLSSHADHGGFEVKGEYTTDVPIPCRPEMEEREYQAMCLARIREEVAVIEAKLARLTKSLSEEHGRCQYVLLDPPRADKQCAREIGHDGIHQFESEG